MARACDDREASVSLRIERFVADLDRCVDFYARVLRFVLVQDERATGYVFLARDEADIGAVRTTKGRPEFRRPPITVEIVLEVDDI